MKKILTSFWPALLWTILIFILLGVDNEKVPEMGLFNFQHKDKFYHFAVFLVFAFLWYCLLLHRYRLEPAYLTLLLILIGAVYGMGMEVFQQAFTNRQFSWWDGLADVLGTVAGVVWAKKSPYGNRGRNQN
jgi:VanZ family protein